MKKKLDVFFRTLAAIIGGYIVSVAFSISFVRILVWLQACEQNEAVMVATMLSYIVYFIIIITSFSRKSSWLLWRDILLSLSFLYGIYWLMSTL
jgi:Kef-type K+ transport system membrane component KefB